MKLVLIATVLGCLVCGSLADETVICGPMDNVKVKRQLDHVFEGGKNQLEFIRDMFQKLFDVMPEARQMVPQFRSDNLFHPKFQAFGQRILTNFVGIFHTMDDPDALAELIKMLIVEDQKTGIKPEISGRTRGVLMETLEEYIGNHFAWDSWTACLNSFDTIALKVLKESA